MVHVSQGRTLINAAMPVVSRAYASASKVAPNKDHHVLSLPDSAFPKGFQVAATHAGVKKKSGALDLGVLVSTADTPCNAAACFTRNVFKAAPVVVSTKVLEEGNGRVRGFVVNSGCANAVTGSKGMQDAWAMSKGVTDGLASSSGSTGEGTLVMSTGVIGQHLPIDAITSKIPSLLSSLSRSSSSWMSLAKAFMTTDTFPKLRARSFKLGSQTVRIAGIDKGAGMIHPNMGPPHATLLGVVATDAAISPKALQSALTYAVDRSFNSITVDGDMSTNDTILCLANGAAASESGERAQEITEEGNPEEFAVFKEELRSFAEELAQLVVRDGEGATKFVTVRVEVRACHSEIRSVTHLPHRMARHTKSVERLLPRSQPLPSSRRLCTAKTQTGDESSAQCKKLSISASFINLTPALQRVHQLARRHHLTHLRLRLLHPAKGLSEPNAPSTLDER
jgi:glutamate N-acetyltransferase/amino-acid N-acetyltransferase